MGLNKDEEKLIRDCISAYRRTILQIQRQISQLENQMCKNNQIDLFDIRFDIPVKTAKEK